MEKIIAIGLFLLMACSKDKTIIQQQLTGSLENLIGEWKLKESTYKVNNVNTEIPNNYARQIPSSEHKIFFFKEGLIQFGEGTQKIVKRIIKANLVGDNSISSLWQIKLDDYQFISIVVLKVNQTIRISYSNVEIQSTSSCITAKQPISHLYEKV